MAQVTPLAIRPTPAAASGFSHVSWAWAGVLPFFVFALMFLILPTGLLVVGGFQDAQGHFTLRNLLDLFTPTILSSYLISIKVSAASAIGGAFIGFFLAYAAIAGGLPPWVRSTLMTFSGVASNFAGVPLAFAFLATLGRTGLATALLIKVFRFNIYSAGFNLLSFAGLTLTYMYFQIPLMVLNIALPILWPPLLGAALLLFANAFGAVATAYALTGSSLNIVTLVLYAQIRGDVLHNQNLGYALALGMILITGLSNAAYIWLRGRSERWLR